MPAAKKAENNIQMFHKVRYGRQRHIEKNERIVKPAEMLKVSLSKETLIPIVQNELKVNVWSKNE